MPILAVEGVTKRFGPNEVLKNVTLALDAQEIRAICGENGAGKSTLVKIITGVHAADGGRVLIDGAPVGKEVRRWIDMRRRVRSERDLRDRR